MTTSNYSGLTETRKKDREIMLREVVKLCEKHGVGHTVQRYYLGDPRSVTVCLEDVTGLALRVEFEGGSPHPNIFVLSWHMALSGRDNGLIINPAFCPDINPYHHRKATDVCWDVCWGFEHLMQVLERRLAMIADGTAMLAADGTAMLAGQLKTALADAIRRPMGVIPDSAAGLVTPADLDAAEVRRTATRELP